MGDAETPHAMTREEFCARFKARLVERFDSYVFSDGESIEAYADHVGASYWEELDQREEGPEDCADADYEEMVHGGH